MPQLAPPLPSFDPSPATYAGYAGTVLGWPVLFSEAAATANRAAEGIRIGAPAAEPIHVSFQRAGAGYKETRRLVWACERTVWDDAGVAKTESWLEPTDFEAAERS
jgi:hypothetical protein